MTLTISPRRVTQVLTFVVLSLTFASIAAQLSKYSLGHDYYLLRGVIKVFNVDREANIPTWYASSLLLLCSILLLSISYARKIDADRYFLHWRALSIIFLYLSIDEAASIHEMAIRPLRSALSASGFFYFTWVVPAAAFVLIFVLVYRRFLADLPVKTRRLFLLAGTLYVGGALGVELVGGRHMDLYGGQNVMFAFITTVEELLEMLGVVVFIFALLSYISAYLKDVRVHVDDGVLSLSPEPRPRPVGRAGQDRDPKSSRLTAVSASDSPHSTGVTKFGDMPSEEGRSPGFFAEDWPFLS